MNDWLDRSLIEGPALVLVLSSEAFEEAMDTMGIPPANRPVWLRPGWNACVQSFDTGRGEAVNVVSIANHAGRDAIEVAGLLVHEAVHVVQDILARMGEKAPGDEFVAYATQTVSMRLMASYARQMGWRTD